MKINIQNKTLKRNKIFIITKRNLIKKNKLFFLKYKVEVKSIIKL